MKYYKFFFLGAVFLICSCQGQDKSYVATYEDDKIVGVLIDLYTAEAAVKDIQDDLKDSLASVYRSQIEVIHNVEMAFIEKDIKQLQSRPSQFNELHKIVQDSIVMMEKNFNKRRAKKITKEKNKTDIKTDTEFKELVLPSKDN